MESMHRYCQSPDCSFAIILPQKVYNWSYLVYFFFKITMNHLIACINITLSTLFSFHHTIHLCFLVLIHRRCEDRCKSMTILKLHAGSYFHTGGTCRGT